MAVLDQSYRRWTGQAASHARRILVIPRYDLLEILEKRTWLLAWLACLVPPLVLGGMAYVATNLSTLRSLVPMLPPQLQVPPPGSDFYGGFLKLQCWMLVAFAVLVGPPLATRDFANGAMALYLSKSMRRWDYVLGRCAVLATMLSLASWIPYLAIFVMEYGMADAAWRAGNRWLFVDIVTGTLPTVLLLTLVIVAIGAIVQRVNLARAALLFLLLGVKPLVLPLEAALDAPAVRILSPTDTTGRLREIAFEDAEPEPAGRGSRPAVVRGPAEMSGGWALFGLLAWIAAALVLISRRVRPVEVVR